MFEDDCKICGAKCLLFAVVDLGRHCNRQLALSEPMLGVDVTYFSCSLCGFLFTRFFDNYSKNDLAREIYNEGYIKVDPLYPRVRPQMNARFLTDIVKKSWIHLRQPETLDYGAGNGILAQLIAPCLHVDSYDGLNEELSRFPEKEYDLVFCAEVVEHIPQPAEFAADWVRLTKPSGAVIFSTLTLPENIESVRGDWWYLGPRNGHVSLYSSRSLDILLSQFGFRYEQLSEEWHLAIRGAGNPFDIEALKAVVDARPRGFIEL